MKTPIWLLAMLTLILAACDGATATPTSATGSGAADVYYVELSGDDANFCDSPAEACRTIEGALEKASADASHFDEIHIGVGTFSTERIFVEKNISLIGAGMGSTILQGSAGAGPALLSSDPVRVHLRDLTVTNAGGGVQAAIYFTDPLSELLLTRVHVFDNNAHGVEAGAPLHIRDSVIEGNRGNGQAGGVVGAGLIERSQFLNNIGSAAYTVGGELTIIDSYFEGNQADSGAGIRSNGDTIVERSTFTRNGPAGDPITPTVIHQQSGSLTMLNVTMSGNVRAIAAYAVSAAVDIRFSTFVDNLEGIFLFLDNTGRMNNNLIGGNSFRDCFNSGGPSFEAIGNIVATRNSRCSAPISPFDIGVGPLADNGGETPTHALLEGSPAIDAASDCIAEDQTGVTRPIGLACDAGAYEAAGVASSLEGDFGGGDEEGGFVFPIVTALQNANCRRGPNTAFEVFAFLFEGQQAEVQGRNASGDWLLLQPPDEDTLCWVAFLDEVLELDGSLEGILVLFGPLLPTATPDPDEGDSANDNGSSGDDGGDSGGGNAPTGCLYQGPNDNQATCYSPCPVDPAQYPACTP